MGGCSAFVHLSAHTPPPALLRPLHAAPVRPREPSQLWQAHPLRLSKSQGALSVALLAVHSRSLSLKVVHNHEQLTGHADAPLGHARQLKVPLLWHSLEGLIAADLPHRPGTPSGPLCPCSLLVCVCVCVCVCVFVSVYVGVCVSVSVSLYVCMFASLSLSLSLSRSLSLSLSLALSLSLSLCASVSRQR
jgi:hypothetical protein